MALLALSLACFKIEPRTAFFRFVNVAILLHAETHERLTPAAAQQVCSAAVPLQACVLRAQVCKAGGTVCG
jgi:hypothetical protein